MTFLGTPTSTAKPAGMSDAEWQARLGLAACYRISDHLGRVEMISHHVTVRVPGEDGHPLIHSDAIGSVLGGAFAPIAPGQRRGRGEERVGGRDLLRNRRPAL
ncbi:hypothetical protein ACFS5L_24585 [Streptomyces phyllanthi]|uniref:hypothetical protein n=1 Tax=Streptomyces phyllanthi TaxID=1803180 RepID=UPI0018845D16|nr:hypothetical protein [Streptomyces phyllanthi]